ncbi:MAG: acyl-CoA dehydrogenase [Acidimicrobiaceae bacterium]|nr:acyl-CoA dehydrogenase [Acidimicrobiaceae bacterium]
MESSGADKCADWASPERVELRRTVRGFTERYVLPNLDEWEKDGEVPRNVHRVAGKLGLLAAGFPENVGGVGDMIDNLVITDELISAGASSGFAAALLTHHIALPHIVASGDEYLIERYVLPSISGEMIGCLGVTEPTGGSDVAGLATKAEDHGDHWLINGSKTYITSGARADFIVVAASTDGAGHAGVSLIVVDTSSAGFSVTRRLEKMGWACSDTAEITLVDVEVPKANLVGERGTGFYQIMRNFDGERLGLAVHGYALASRGLELAVEWARTRRSSGAPLTSLQTIRHKLAEMARQTEVARVFTQKVATDFAAGRVGSKEVAMAKNTSVYACDYVVDQALQIHGGLGYMKGSEVERIYRDARILGIGGGTNEIMNEIIAKRMALV